MGFGLSTKKDRGTGQDSEDIHIEDKDESGYLGVGPYPFMAEFCAVKDDDCAKDHDSWNENDRSPAEGHVKSFAVHADQAGLQDVEDEVHGHYGSVDMDNCGEPRTRHEPYHRFQGLLEIGGEIADEDGSDREDGHGEEESMVSALSGLDGVPELLAFEHGARSDNARVFRTGSR